MLWFSQDINSPRRALLPHISTTLGTPSDDEKDKDIHKFLVALHDQQVKLGAERQLVDILLPTSLAFLIDPTDTPVPPEMGNRRYLADLISGDVDADRMDFLRRDAFYTGVPIGGVDISELINALTFYRDDHGQWRVGLLATSAAAVEGLLQSRDLAYRRVYYHESDRASQEMLIQGLYEIAESGDLSPYQLARLTDDELLVRLETTSEFTKDIALRIRENRLYRPLPVELNVYRDLDTSGTKRWQALRKGLPETFERRIEESRRIAGEAKIQNGFLIVDAVALPLAKESAYTARYLYDESTGKTKSLIEVLPHLELLHGPLKEPDEKRASKEARAEEEAEKLHEEYVQRVSKILVFVPYDSYFENLALDHVQAEAKRKPEELDEEEYRTVASTVYAGTVGVLVKYLLDYLEVRDPAKRSELEGRFREATIKAWRSYVPV